MKKWILCTAAILLLCSSIARADDIDDGVKAYDEGNYAQAIELFLPLANQGDAAAQFYLGLMYANGKGVTQDHKEAMKWYRLAAAQGDTDAQHNLGEMYFNGHGVTQDYVRAHMWFNLAASQGSKEAKKLNIL